MATFYPTITDNADVSPNGNIAFDLVNFTDNSFDIYKFQETDTLVDSAYLVFVIKNTATTASADLSINSINILGGGGHFTLDFIEASETLLHLGKDGASENKLKANSGAVGVSGVTYLAGAANSSGSSAYMSHNATDIADSDDSSLNADSLSESGNSHIIPIYTTANIVANDIPPNSYAAFVVKYKPTEAFTSEDLDGARLVIDNSDSTQVIYFDGAAVNTLYFSGSVGTASSPSVILNQGGVFTPGANVLQDGGNLNFGLHPIGYDYGATDKTVEFGDLTGSPGNWMIEEASFLTPLAITQPGGTNITADNQGYSQESHNGLLPKLGSSFISGLTGYTNNEDYINYILPTNVLAGSSYNSTENSTLYRNFGFTFQNNGTSISGTSACINYRSSHRNWVSYADNYDDYYHQEESDLTLKQYYRLLNVLNQDYPEQTAPDSNNRVFLYSITTGFYNMLSMGTNQTNYHAGTVSHPFDFRYTNGSALYDSTNVGPYLSSTSSGPLFRGGATNIAVHLRYNNFPNIFTNANYLLTTGGINLTASNDDSLKLYSSYSGDVEASHYNTSDFDGIHGTSVTDAVTGSAIPFGSPTSVHGEYLGLKFPAGTSSFPQNHMYENGDYTKVGWREKEFGLFRNTFIPAHAGDDNIWNNLGRHNLCADSGEGYAESETYGLKYRIAFLPVPSTLELKSHEDIGLATNNLVKLEQTTQSPNTQTTYICNTSTEAVGTWYEYNSTNTSSADVKTKSYDDNAAAIYSSEGDWYGAAGITVNQPAKWSEITNSRRLTESSGSGPYVSHAPTNETISKNGTHEAYDEAGAAANFMFRLTDSSYNSSDQKYRSAGRLYFSNTGDYPIHVHSVSIGDVSFGLSAEFGVSDVYMTGIDNTLMPNPNALLKPTANSNTPTWYVGVGNSSSWTNGATNGLAGTGNSASSVANGTAGNLEMFNGSTSSDGADDEYIDSNNYVDDAGGASRRRFVAGWNPGAQGHVNIGFELDPAGVSTDDQGFYYAQVLVSYYVGDYKNRKLTTTSATGYISTESLTIGSAAGDLTNYKTRLHCSKYLIRCKVSAVGEIVVVDSEGDEAPSTITLPTLSIG